MTAAGMAGDLADCTMWPQASNQWVSVTTHSGSLKLRQLQDRLKELARLPENWDGCDSPVISQIAQSKAGDIVGYIDKLGMPLPRIVPVSGGGLQFEFEQNGRELELEVLPNGEVICLLVHENGQMAEAPLLPFLMHSMPVLAGWIAKQH